MKSLIPANSLRYSCCDIEELSENQQRIWQELTTRHRAFRSPFFAHEYHQLIARCEQHVQVGLIQQAGETVGFFPFELEKQHQARPVGSIFCDYQGVIAAPNLDWEVIPLLKACGLKYYAFDHQLANQPQWKPYHQHLDISWSIDLADGFDHYAALLQQQKRKQLIDANRKKRMLEREVGPALFVPHQQNSTLLEMLLQWKSEQWAKSGWPGRFTATWEQKLMQQLMQADYPGFGGLFSVLTAGGQPVAMHIGLRSRRVWHYWTTAYHPEYKRYSPGIVLLVEMLRCANKLCLDEVDLGKESFRYKQRLHTHTVPLAEGCITHTSLDAV